MPLSVQHQVPGTGGLGPHQLAVQHKARAAGPGRHAHRQPSRSGRSAGHPDLGRPGPRGAGIHPHGQRVPRHRGQVMLQRSGEPHDVRRAARAGKPLPAAARVVLLEVIGPPLQRVHVEEPCSARGGRAREPRCTGCVPCGRRTGHRRWPAAAARTTGSSRWPRTSRCKPGPAAARTGHRSSPPHTVTHSRRSGTSSRPPCRPSGRSRSAAAPHRRSRPARPPRPLPGTARGPRARPRCSPAGLARGPEGNAGRTRNHRSACARAARSTGGQLQVRPVPGLPVQLPLPSPQSDGHPARPAGPGTCLPGDRRTASPRRAAGQDRP